MHICVLKLFKVTQKCAYIYEYLSFRGVVQTRFINAYICIYVYMVEVLEVSVVNGGDDFVADTLQDTDVKIGDMIWPWRAVGFARVLDYQPILTDGPVWGWQFDLP